MTESSRFLGAPIYSLQTMLRAISAVRPQVLPLIPDGVYGANTYGSVLSFQQAFGLPQTGVTDYATWVRIVEVYNRTKPRRRGVFPFLPAEEGTLSPPEQHLLTAMLEALPRAYGVPEPRRDLPQALRWVQRRAALPETGLADPATQAALLGIYRNSVF